jgi:hypothetical protein
MVQKQLEANSAFNQFDANGDGVVSDKELMQAERQAELNAKIERWRNQDALEDRQRQIALIAILSCIGVVLLVMSPLVSIARIEATNALINLFLTFNTGVVVGFMGLSAWSKRKAE